MKTRNDLWGKLSETIAMKENYLRVNTYCLSIKYNGNKTAVFEPCEETYKLLQELSIIDGYKGSDLYKMQSSCEIIGSNGLFKMVEKKVPVYFNQLHLSETEARLFAAYREYESALKTGNFLQRNTAKVINLFNHNQKKIA